MPSAPLPAPRTAAVGCGIGERSRRGRRSGAPRIRGGRGGDLRFDLGAGDDFSWRSRRHPRQSCGSVLTQFAGTVARCWACSASSAFPDL